MLYLIIGVTVLISLLAFNNPELFDRLKFNAYAIKHHKQGWRFFSYGLIHAGWAHLLINMLVLYSFGDSVEYAFKYYFGFKGILFFLLLYVGGILFSVLFDFRKHKDDIYYNAVGASGAVAAVLFASILIDPTNDVVLLFLPIPIPSPIFGVLYLVYSAYMSKRAQDNIGHSAHFWGAIFGIVFTIVLKPELVNMFLRQVFG